MVLINYSGHSGFSVESETHMLIFDYSEGVLPQPVKNNKKKIFVFISHAHEDHFNPEVFTLSKNYPNVKYIISYDIGSKIPESYGIHDYIIAEPGMDVRIESRFRVKALPSTDCGVAFLAGFPGRNIFHAGDLNLWLWEGMREHEVYEMTEKFKEYTRPLKGFWIDTAFLPLDSRQGMYSYLGFDYYMKHFRIKHAIPMHFSGSSKICEDFLCDSISRDYKSKIICVEHGERISVI